MINEARKAVMTVMGGCDTAGRLGRQSLTVVMVGKYCMDKIHGFEDEKLPVNVAGQKACLVLKRFCDG